MAHPKRIGIYFTAGDNWLGGVYYLINLVNSFSYLKKEEQNNYTFIIFYNQNSEKFINLFDFKNVEKIKIKVGDSRKLFLKSLLLRKNYFITQEIMEAKLDGLYPFNDFPVKTQMGLKLVSWYPDLQHHFYPEYFEKLSLILREFRLRKLLKFGQLLVLSSNDVASHFLKFYPKYTINKKILPFISLTDESLFPNKLDLLKKYQIQRPYFIVCNQFYQHKDHKTVLKVIEGLSDDVLVVFTGVMEDYRNPNYISELKDIIKDGSLSKKVLFLGVITRNDQLSLMKNALAVIQPSLFEGWSTVVEDVKSIGGRIIVSDIEVHKEQLQSQGLFFKKGDSLDLANKMVKITENSEGLSLKFDYDKHIIEFAKSFAEIF